LAWLLFALLSNEFNENLENENNKRVESERRVYIQSTTFDEAFVRNAGGGEE